MKNTLAFCVFIYFSTPAIAEYCGEVNKINNAKNNCIGSAINFDQFNFCNKFFENSKIDNKKSYVLSMQRNYSLSGNIGLYVEIYNCESKYDQITNWKQESDIYIFYSSNNLVIEINKDKMDELIYTFK